MDGVGPRDRPIRIYGEEKVHILPVLAGLEVLVLGGGPDIFFSCI